MIKNRDLQQKAVRGIAHLGFGSALGKVASLITTILLARILTPEDYGVMALAMVVIGFIGFFNEVGIGAAIVQKKELSIGEVNGCFLIAMLAGIFLCVGTIVFSNIIAGFFKVSKLGEMISLLSVAFVLGAMSTIPLGFLRKELKFKGIAKLYVFEVLAVTLVSIPLAVFGYGAWSLVWGFVASNVVKVLGSYILSSWFPSRIYDMKKAVILVKYGLKITLSRIFWYSYTNADKVIIGKFLGVHSLGVYDMAMSLATLPGGQVTTLVTNVASPLISKIQKDLSQVSLQVLKLTRGIAYVTYPVLIGMFVCSKELVDVILGEKWADIVVPFKVLCLLGLVKSVDPLLSQVLISIGHAGRLSIYTAMCGLVMTGAIFIASVWGGLLGVSVVWILIYPFLAFKLLHDVCNIIDLKIKLYLDNLKPILIAAVVMGFIVTLVREGLILVVPVPMFILMGEVISGIFAYIFWMIFMNKNSLFEIQSVLLDMGVPVKILNRWPFTRGSVE